MAQTAAAPNTGMNHTGTGTMAPSSGPQTPGPTGTMSQSQAAAGQEQNSSDNRVQQAQQRLHAAGLYQGPVDGVMGPDTKAALARFQAQNGLSHTEQLDEQTFARLMQSPGTGATGTGSGSSMPGTTMPSSSGQDTTTTPGAAGSTTGGMHR
jgi:peptidoglycan hydrolase-like protein with peptidoglycan-binding domain